MDKGDRIVVSIALVLLALLIVGALIMLNGMMLMGDG